MPDSMLDLMDIPEATDAQLRRTRRVGRPSTGNARQLIAIRISPKVLARLRRLAANQHKPYQTYIHELLEHRQEGRLNAAKTRCETRPIEPFVSAYENGSGVGDRLEIPNQSIRRVDGLSERIRRVHDLARAVTGEALTRGSVVPRSSPARCEGFH